MAEMSPIEPEFGTTADAAAHEASFKAKIAKALASNAPSIPHDAVMAEIKAILETQGDAAACLAR